MSEFTLPSFISPLGVPLSQVAAAPPALTFDDVLLLPGPSQVLPHQVDLTSTLGRGVALAMPFCSAAMDTVTQAPMAIAMAQAGGMGVIHKNMMAEDQAAQVAQARAALGAHSPVAAAVGAGDDALARGRELLQAGATALVVDTAHGHAAGVLHTVRVLRDHYPELLLIAGNVATAEATFALLEAGADVVKVGVGPGSICTTRQVAGVGVPQLSAIGHCAQAIAAARARGHRAALIADGGMRTSGDVVKALAAGADAVMFGRLLAGSDEAPGEVVEQAGERRKVYRGMGSLPAMRQGSADRYFQGANQGNRSNKLVAEGVVASVACTGPVSAILAQLAGGVRSGMGYVGAADLLSLVRAARFVRQSPAGLAESHVHGVSVAANAQGG